MNGFRSCRHSLSDWQFLPRTAHVTGVLSVGPLTKVPATGYQASPICSRRVCSISAGCSHLTWGLSGPAFERMRECAHLMKAEQPRNLGYMQLAVIEVTNR